jgi:hypothetical protein
MVVQLGQGNVLLVQLVQTSKATQLTACYPHMGYKYPSTPPIAREQEQVFSLNSSLLTYRQ